MENTKKSTAWGRIIPVLNNVPFNIGDDRAYWFRYRARVNISDETLSLLAGNGKIRKTYKSYEYEGNDMYRELQPNGVYTYLCCGTWEECHRTLNFLRKSLILEKISSLQERYKRLDRSEEYVQDFTLSDEDRTLIQDLL